MEKPHAINAYQLNQLTADPAVKRLLVTIENGIQACQQHNQPKLIKVILLLHNSIDKTIWPEFAEQSTKFYSQLLGLAEQSNYSACQKLLVKLHNGWQQTHSSKKV
ncbi:hypothetical protein DS2_05485 [Catenovulum agarivorans DS-2]|uniref:Uncharacterized protein n=1 Tax=Catenovulum agarivorans DS-2 TaxID=1328313 RepID=W7R050_9ALTE|nr:hypothetical protein [Catenovulum agarivorans]EWH10995.1 hypothetical protein DS2_05485 [Catenovulum agarivorans DS-2]